MFRWCFDFEKLKFGNFGFCWRVVSVVVVGACYGIRLPDCQIQGVVWPEGFVPH